MEDVIQTETDIEEDIKQSILMTHVINSSNEEARRPGSNGIGSWETAGEEVALYIGGRRRFSGRRSRPNVEEAEWWGRKGRCVQWGVQGWERRERSASGATFHACFCGEGSEQSMVLVGKRREVNRWAFGLSRVGYAKQDPCC